MANGIIANYLGKLYDWGSITLSILSSTQIGVSRITINYKRASDNIYGAGQQPVGYINKNYTYDATLSLLYDEFQQIVAAALALGMSPMDIPPFSIVCTFGFSQDPLVNPLSLTLQNCRFTTNDFNGSQGNGGFYNDYPIAYAGLIVVQG